MNDQLNLECFLIPSMTLPKGFGAESEDKAMPMVSISIPDELTEKEILLKILQKLTSIEKLTAQIADVEIEEMVRKKVDRDTNPTHWTGL